jgi:hypothetical protein
LYAANERLDAENAALREELHKWKTLANAQNEENAILDKRAEAAEDEAEILRSENLTIGDRMEAQYKARIEQLEAALRVYGGHLAPCSREVWTDDEGFAHVKCDCGLDALLAAEKAPE